jgi:hypothetical protein
MNAYHLLFALRASISRECSPTSSTTAVPAKDLARWLRVEFMRRGVYTRPEHPEDGGWEVPPAFTVRPYYLCLSGISDDGSRTEASGVSLLKNTVRSGNGSPVEAKSPPTIRSFD